MSILVGSTGYVGSHLSEFINFEYKVHRPDIEKIQGLKTDLLICAGLPAEKWKANADPISDWQNIQSLARSLSSVKAESAILISTIDVYQPPENVDERTPGNFSGPTAYGTNRAWFEAFFSMHFQKSHIVRLPGLFSANVRKNLIHDLIHNKQEQWVNVNSQSSFQFFNMHNLGAILQKTQELDIEILNVNSEPILAKEIARIFDVELKILDSKVNYDMKSQYAKNFGGKNGYLFSKEQILFDISEIKAGINS